MSSTRIALGIFEKRFIPPGEFVFVVAAAEYLPDQRLWAKLGNPSRTFPPQGTFYVPGELIPASFAYQHAAAWVVEDKGADHKAKGFGARYKATSNFQCPMEVISIAVASNDHAALRRLLLDEGVEDNHGLGDREYLLKFTDGRIAGPVQLAPGWKNPQRYFCPETTLFRPLPAWTTKQSLASALFSVEFERRPRTFAATDELPPSDECLDFASAGDMIRQSETMNGNGSHLLIPYPVSPLSKAFETFLQSLNAEEREARLSRLQTYLDRAGSSEDRPELGEMNLRAHPTFQQAMATLGIPVKLSAAPSSSSSGTASISETKGSQLREGEISISRPVTAPETGNGRRDEAISVPVLAEPAPSHGVAPHPVGNGIPDTISASSSSSGQNDSVIGNSERPAARSESTDAPTGPQPLSMEEITADARPLSTAAEAIDLLEKNLKALGLAPISAISLAREAFVSAALGQIIFVSGSFARPVAETIAQTFAGRRRIRVSIPVGFVTPLPLPTASSDDGITALVVEGANRSCLDAYGDDLTRLLVDRALKLRAFPPSLLVVATLLDGPSAIPPSPGLIAYGPVLASNYYKWMPSQPSAIIAGFCKASAWKISGAEQDLEGIQELLNELVHSPNPLWEQNVRAAGRCLRHFSSHPKSEESAEDGARASLLFGWILPFIIANGVNLSEHADRVRNEFSSFRDQRLVRFLTAHGVEVAK